MRDPQKYSWWHERNAMRIPPRAPRLPRNHFAMRPHLTNVQRAARNGVAMTVIVACIVWLFLR